MSITLSWRDPVCHDGSEAGSTGRPGCLRLRHCHKLVLGLRQARALDRKPSRRTALERLQADAVSVCLVAPFVEAAVADRRVALRALAQAWLAYMAAEEVLTPLCHMH